MGSRGGGGPARVPVLDVHAGNAAACWESARRALRAASFIAMDAEMSGLGNRKALLAQSIEERYVAVRNAARTRSLLSIGIACFRLLPGKGYSGYEVHVLNLTLLSKEEYTVEPQSLKFLVEHGFDFNKQYTQGLPYRPGNDVIPALIADTEPIHLVLDGQTIEVAKTVQSAGVILDFSLTFETHINEVIKTGVDGTAPGARALFSEVVLAERPLVLHNGLLDLAFLFQALHANLPPTLQTFMADLATLLPAGVYDTKHIVETETDMAASFLEYAFRKCRRGGTRSGGAGSGVHMEFGDIPPPLSDYVDERLFPELRAGPEKGDGAAQTDPPLCERFSAYGWCSLGVKCPLSHDIERILDEDEKLGQRKQQRRPRQRKKPRSSNQTDNGVSGQAAVPADDSANVADAGVDVPLENASVDSSQGKCDGAEGDIDCAENRPERAVANNEVQALPSDQCVHKRATDLANGSTAKRFKTGDEKLETVPLGELDSGPLDSGPLDTQPKIGSPGDNQSGNGEEMEPKRLNSTVAVASGSHRAGFDAFMTGFVFASVLASRNRGSGGRAGTEVGEQIVPDVTENWLPSCRNKLYLSGKAVPLHVCKSAFSSSSRAHRDQMARLGKHIE